MWWSVDDGVRSFPFAAKFSFPEKLDSRVEEQDFVAAFEFFVLDSAIVPSFGSFLV